VLSPVNGSGKHDKVLNSVVGFDAINVMHFLSGNERSANVLLHDKPMFFEPFPFVPNNDISMGVYGPATRLPDMLARATAKMAHCVRGSPVGPVERVPACRADALNLHVPSIDELGEKATIMSLTILKRNCEPINKFLKK